MSASEGFEAALREALAQTYGEPLPPLVMGEGPMQPELALIGEAPGEQESKAGRPFVGPAGRKLDAFLQAVGLPREALYVTNTVKYRPTKQSAAGRLVNRTPTSQEVAFFTPWLLRELLSVQPRWIATLGNTALTALLGKGVRIGEVHGRVVEAEGLPGKLFPLYHPASVIYNPALQTLYAQDLQTLRGLLEAER